MLVESKILFSEMSKLAPPMLNAVLLHWDSSKYEGMSDHLV